jgi:hypothetical protein
LEAGAVSKVGSPASKVGQQGQPQTDQMSARAQIQVQLDDFGHL